MSLLVAARMAGTCSLLLAVAGPLAAQLAGSVQLPAPSGPHRVGTTTWHWIDPARPDVLSADPADVREIMAQLWYPAEPELGAEAAPYSPLRHGLDAIRANAVAAAPFDRDVEPAPLIVICPAGGLGRHLYSALAEDLASHGYAVLATDSPHLNPTVYPDGRAIDPAPALVPSIDLVAGPAERLDSALAQATALGLGDLQLALGHLERLRDGDPSGRLTGRLDLTRIGLIGHGLGGRVCGAVAAVDRRVRAYATMEGPPPREVRRAGLEAAVAVLGSSALPSTAWPILRQLVPVRRNDVLIVTLEGYGRDALTDLSLIEPPAPASRRDPREGLVGIRSFLLAFFDRYVRSMGDRMALVRSAGFKVERYPKPASR
ncbi:MAG: hypothetical protein ACOY71_09475 [Gemmatimonadota bacterium]